METALIRVSRTPEDLAAEAATKVEQLAREAIRASGRFVVALSGGSTPARLYAAMAQEPFRSRFAWDKAHFFWSDERWVSPDSPRSNYKAAWDALLGHADIPPRNVHPVRTAHATAAESAADYESEIVAFFGGPKNTPRFDLVLLGLGNDGHTASLFPGSPVLKEGSRWVAAAEGPGGEPRVTFTYRLINAASCAAFLVSGAEKSGVLRAAIRGEGGHPASGVRPTEGTLAWFVDADAASLLK